jgi:hypothetical protein
MDGEWIEPIGLLVAGLVIGALILVIVGQIVVILAE